MKYSLFSKQLCLSVLLLMFVIPHVDAQTKKIKRPRSRVGISSVDNFVQKSFNLYEKVYKYDGYAASGTPLDDEDIDVLEEALEEVTIVSENAPNILNDLDGKGALKQAKATLQINKAKKALSYSISTSKELLLGQRERNKKKEENTSEDKDQTVEASNDHSTSSTNTHSNTSTASSNISKNLEVYSKYDFVPGDETLFFDDFSEDFIGDFPSRWNTNGSGEVVRINNAEGNWFEMQPGRKIYSIPDVKSLPEDYSIEFDLLTSGLSKKTSANAMFSIYISDTNTFEDGKDHFVKVSIPLGQHNIFSIHNYNYFNGSPGTIDSHISADIRNEILNQPHIAISVTKHRFRLWINETKHLDIPRFIEESNVLNHIKFGIVSLVHDGERVFINNLKVAKGGVDLRRKLMSEGKISTNGILFESGSAKIEPQSLGIVLQISQVLKQDESIKLNIIGHTDSDGKTDANLKLSKARAAAVKEALVSIYNISEERLTTDGKGSSEPVGDNSTSDGKAQNRRVEFIKI